MKRVLCIVGLLAIVSAASADNIAYWSFNDTTNLGTNLLQINSFGTIGAEAEYTNDLGTGVAEISVWGTMDPSEGNLVGTNGGTERNNFGGNTGTSLNAIGGTASGSSFSPVGKDNNGKCFLIELDDAIQGCVLTYATRGTSPGFDTHTFDYSTDNGVTWSSLGSQPANRTSTWSVTTVNFGDVFINTGGHEHNLIRITVTGCSSANGNNHFDNILVAGTTVPVPPTATAATSITASGFSADWNASTDATGYRLDVATDSGFTSFVTGFNDLDVGNVTTSAVNGLSATTQYYYRVRAYKLPGTSVNSNTITVSTLAALATVDTTTITGITTSTAASGGNVTSDGGAAVTARGLCWGTSANPTVAGNHSTDGSGTGSFTSSITGLSPGTMYHVRAYATSSVGTAYGSDLTFTTPTVAPTVTTTAANSITATTASSGGNVTADGGAGVTARGVCWSNTADPTTDDNKTTDGSGTGTFTNSITGLSPNTTYHARAYATNSVGTAYGDDLTFTTSATTPTVTTTAASSITAATASSGGNVTADGGVTVTARGVCWSTAADPTTDDSHTTNGSGTGSFTSSITGLSPSTTYHVRAYATNSAGTAYGDDVTFTSSALPSPLPPSPLPAQSALATVTTAAVSGITTATAECGGNVTADGGAEVAARGVCWGTSANPTTAGNHTTDGSGTGSFTSSLTGLSPNTAYHVRAYATNSKGTAYGSNVTFTTAALPPDDQDQKAPDLQVTVTLIAPAPDQPVQVGQEVPFLVTVENLGTGDANDVTLIVPIPAGMEYVAAQVLDDSTARMVPGQPLVADDKVYINVSDVAPGQQVRIELVLRAKVAGETIVSAIAQSAELPELVLGTPAQVVVKDEYYVIQRPIVSPCGAAGVLPLALTFIGLTSLKRGRRGALR